MYIHISAIIWVGNESKGLRAKERVSGDVSVCVGGGVIVCLGLLNFSPSVRVKPLSLPWFKLKL